MKTALERLLSKVEFEPNTGCWLWTAFLTQAGYGQIGFNGSVQRAHRVSYELHCGPIPDGLFVCHRCDTPACVNPAHLFLGSPKDNVVDMDAKGRRQGKPPVDTKLTEDAVRHIRRREMGPREYAKLYGVGRCAIYDIWADRNWRHVA